LRPRFGASFASGFAKRGYAGVQYRQFGAQFGVARIFRSAATLYSVKDDCAENAAVPLNEARLERCRILVEMIL
jgi:hypothetical protein